MRRRSLLFAGAAAGALIAAPVAGFSLPAAALPRWVPFDSGPKTLRTGDTILVTYRRIGGRVLRHKHEATRPAVYLGAFVDQHDRVVLVEKPRCSASC